MSGRMVGEVLDHAPADLTQLEMLVLVTLAESAAEKDRTARYGVTAEELADKARSTPGAVRNTLGRLKERGLIVPLFEKPRRGLAQNWRVIRMTDATRRAVLNASPHSDANGHVNGHGKRHPTVTLKPVDNSGKRHPTVTQTPRESVTRTPKKASPGSDASR